jgi:hypothetical protein
MGSDTFKIVTGVILPPLGAYMAMTSLGLPGWAGSTGMALFGGGLGVALTGEQAYQALAGLGTPSAPNSPALTTGGGGMNGSPTYGFSGIETGR